MTGCVGEIKSVEKDVLTLSTDYSDADFKIKWDKIASIESDRQFLVETFDGRRLSGSLKADPEKKAAVAGGRDQLQLPEVSTCSPSNGRSGPGSIRAWISDTA